MLRLIRFVAVTAVVGATLLVASAPSASARGVWDPNDVDQRLDVRWFGVRYTDNGDAIVTVTFYPGFKARYIPKGGCDCRNYLWTYLDEYQQGVFFRKNGRIKLSYGDHGSNCCAISRVHRPNATTLVARYTPVDEVDPGYDVFAYSSVHRERDTTDTFHLGPPP